MEIQIMDRKILDRHSPVPLYQQLSDLISREIEDGVLKPGDPLPSENALMKQYEVSRYVVRQTFNNLSRQGLIFTQHGRGSFVCFRRIDKPLDVLQSYHAGMHKSGIEVSVGIAHKAILQPPEPVAAQMELPADSQVFYLERVASANGVPMNVLISYIALSSCGLDHLMQFSGGSLYQYLKEECGVHLHHSRSFIEVVFAGEYESRLLNVARGRCCYRSPALSLKRTAGRSSSAGLSILAACSASASTAI